MPDPCDEDVVFIDFVPDHIGRTAKRNVHFPDPKVDGAPSIGQISQLREAGFQHLHKPQRGARALLDQPVMEALDIKLGRGRDVDRALQQAIGDGGREYDRELRTRA